MGGSWFLLYTTNGGSSAGKLGPFVGQVEQYFSVNNNDKKEDDYYINYVRLGNGIVQGALTANWDVISDTQWQVNFKSIQFKVLGVTLLEKELKARGIWRMTYLDDDLRILYASSSSGAGGAGGAGGASDTVAPKENIYILSKKVNRI